MPSRDGTGPLGTGPIGGFLGGCKASGQSYASIRRSLGFGAGILIMIGATTVIIRAIYVNRKFSHGNRFKS